MISLSSEITDSKGRRAARGWVFFDAECPACASLARRFRPVLEKRGIGLAALQDPRVSVLLAMPEDELLREMRVLTPDCEILGGADAILYLAGQIWWACPVTLLGKSPRILKTLRAAYRWFADRRHCAFGVGSLHYHGKPQGAGQ